MSLRLLFGSLAALALAAGASACGGSGEGGASALSIVMDAAPNSLDPALGDSPQSLEATWLVYTGLVTYAHAESTPSTTLIPGVAESLPRVSRDGLTYVFQLRKGLVYSNGAPVHASDVAHAIERSIRLNWGGKRMLTEHIAGAEAFDAHRASSISGIAANDSTGTVTFRLTAPYGSFLNVLAFPAAAPVPGDTPIANLSGAPPAGVGPYEIADVVPKRSFSLVRSPSWALHSIPGIPVANVDISARVVSNDRSAVEQVLSGAADMLDSNDTVPLALLPRVERQAAGHYLKESIMSDELFFLNVKAKPFDSPLVREAVQYAIDRRVLQRLDEDMLQPDCSLLPSGVIVNLGRCPYGDFPDLVKARELVARSGLRASPVTVWGAAGAPHAEFVDYYAGVLNAIGLKASVKLVPEDQYLSTVGDLHNDPQTGLLSFRADFPSPSDFYQLLDARSIRPQESRNLSQVDDPHIQSELAALVPLRDWRSPSAERRWQALDEYVARKAYVFVIGHHNGVKLTSDRVDFNSTVWHLVYGTDWSVLRLK